MLNRLNVKPALFPVRYIYIYMYNDTISHTYNYIIVYHCTFYFPVTEIFMIFNVFLLLCPSCQSFQRLSILITKVASHQCSGRSFSCAGSLVKALGFRGKKLSYTCQLYCCQQICCHNRCYFFHLIGNSW